MTDESRLLAARLLAASPSAMPLDEALEHIRARRAQLLCQPEVQPEPDFGPEPMPLITNPEQFAGNFWEKRKLPGPNDEPPKPKPTAKPKKPRLGRRPVGDLPPAADRFTVIDGTVDKKAK